MGERFRARKAVLHMERTMMRRRMFLRGVGIDISLSIHKLTSVRLGWSAGVSAEIHDASMTIMSALGYGVERDDQSSAKR